MGQHCTVITFTCDRLGVGQSMAVSSTALVLAANGRRVLAIDWDLGKPSLAKYFIPLLAPDALEENDGVIDVVWGYASAARHAPPTVVPELQRRFAAVLPTACAIPDELRVRDGGALHLLSAGREPRRSVRVNYFSWGEFFDRLDGEGLLVMILRELQHRYDHILIDSSHSPASRFPILSADIFVPCFTLDHESTTMAGAITRWVTSRLGTRKHSVYPLPLRVEHAELALLQQAREMSQRVFREFEEATIIPVGHQSRTGLEVPYTSFYANQRVLAPLFEDAYHGTVVAAYLGLACALARQPNLEWKAPAEQQVAKFRSTYAAASDRLPAHEMQPPWPYSGNEPYVFVSYARDDRDEVMPVLQELTNLEWRLWWDQEIPGGSEWYPYLRGRIKNARHVLAFLSARSVRSKWVAEEIRLAHEFGKPLLSIRLDWSDAPEETRDILSRYQILDKSAADFREQLGRGMQFLHASSDAT